MGGFIAGVFRWVPVIISAVQAVEKVADKKGKDKQDAAVEIVGTLIPVIESSISREVVDEVLVQDAIRRVIDAIVSLQNVTRDVLTKRAAANANR